MRFTTLIQFVERLPLRTPYPKVVERLASIYSQLEPPYVAGIDDRILAAYGKARPHERRVRDVLVDATGVGKPVVDLIREKGVRCTAVSLTGGEKATVRGDELSLAKELLVSRLQVLLQQRRIHLPSKMAEAQALTEELLNYEIKVTSNANLQMGVFKTGAHDDLATALGLACWEDNSSGTISIGRAPQMLAEWFGGVGGARPSSEPLLGWRG